MRSGFTEAQPVNPEPDPDTIKVKWSFEAEITLRELRDLADACDHLATIADFNPLFNPVLVIGAQAYEAAKAQLGRRHVNGHENPHNADLIVPVLLAVDDIAEAGRDAVDELEALVIGGTVEQVKERLGADVAAVWDALAEHAA